MNSPELNGKVAVVTGGSRGIGRAIVMALLRAGAKVVFCARNFDPNAPDAELEAQRHGEAQFLGICADISQPHEVERIFDVALAEFGGVDVAINNAAVSYDSLLVSQTTGEWDEMMAINCNAAFLVARRAVREFLKAEKSGRIISVGSVVQNGAPSNAAYAASKGALVGLTRAIAEQYAKRGLFAHLVVVGYVETEMTSGLPEAARRAIIQSCPLRRKADESEIASVVAFLASERGRGLNGQEIYVAGGLREVNG